MKIRVYYRYYNDTIYKIPAQLVQNFGHTPHSMCSYHQNYGIWRSAAARPRPQAARMPNGPALGKVSACHCAKSPESPWRVISRPGPSPVRSGAFLTVCIQKWYHCGAQQHELDASCRDDTGMSSDLQGLFGSRQSSISLALVGWWDGAVVMAMGTLC